MSSVELIQRLLMKRLHWLALPLGLISVLSFAPFYWWFLSFGTLAGFFWLLHGARSSRQAFLTGLLFGNGLFLGGVSWVYISINAFGGMPPLLALLATVIFCQVLSVFPALVGWLYFRWRYTGSDTTSSRINWCHALIFSALYTLSDWLRSWVLTGFPWLLLGYTQTPSSPLAGFAPIFGVLGLSFLSALIATMAFCGRLGWVLIVSFGVAGFGLTQYQWSEPTGEPLSIALIQGNTPLETKFDPGYLSEILQTYRALMEQNPAQLTILPETAFPMYFEDMPGSYLQEIKQLAKRENGDVLFGVVTGNNTRYWNSAVSVGHSANQHYSKKHLVPFGEFMPLGFGWIMQKIKIPLANFTSGGSDQPLLMLAGKKIAPNICYEDVFGNELIGSARQAELLVNLSNTAWFGDSLAQYQHLQITQMRAMETGRSILRSTNTGITAVVLPTGQVQASLPPFQQGVLKAHVQTYTGMTPFLLWGNWPIVILSLFTVLGTWLYSRSRCVHDE